MTPTRLRCGVVCAVDDDAVRRAESTTVHTSVRTRRPDLLVIARTVLLRTSSRMTEASPNATRWHIGLSSYVVRRTTHNWPRWGDTLPFPLAAAACSATPVRSRAASGREAVRAVFTTGN